MKQVLKTLSVIVLTIGIFNLSAKAQEESRKEKRNAKKEVEYQNLKTLIDSGYFTINIRDAQPSKGRNINLSTYGADIKFEKTKVTSYMPYYGETHAPTIGKQTGVNFEQEVEDFNISFNDDKRQVLISFVAKANNEIYTFKITISGTESARVSLNLSKSSPISYFGVVVKNKDK